MKCHSDWSSRAFSFEPVAPDTGPFAGRGFLESLWNLFPVGELCLAENEAALVPLVQTESGLEWVGHPDLVDYRSPLGDGATQLIADVMAQSPAGLYYRFDSLPIEATDTVSQGLARAGLDFQPVVHAVAARLSLPDTFGSYLEGIGNKQRHEIERKRRRFRDEHGDPMLTTLRGTNWGFQRFVKMHRDSGGEKGNFMTGEIESWFAALADQDGWRVDLLCNEDGEPVATTFSWADGDGFYLYNSAYDRRASGSPGIVLLSMLIEQLIEESYSVFDFLKGEEPYKFRLGATRRPLFRFEGST